MSGKYLFLINLAPIGCLLRRKHRITKLPVTTTRTEARKEGVYRVTRQLYLCDDCFKVFLGKEILKKVKKDEF